MEDIETLREKVALACRILAMNGLVGDITGHVSVRVPGTDTMLIRCRGDQERGLAFTAADSIRLVDFDGNGEEITPTHQLPLELPIHGELLRNRPEIGAVVHAHPRATMLCGITGLDLRPIIGCYNVEGMRLAHEGIPLFPRSILIRTKELGQQLAATMGDKTACLMKGHGVTVVGATVEEATIRAIQIDALADITLRAAAAGRTPDNISDEDIADFLGEPGAGPAPKPVARADEWVWKTHVAMLSRLEQSR